MKKILATIYAVFYAAQVTADTAVLGNRNTYTLWTTQASHWIDFCNGLIHAYASLAVTSCIPVGNIGTTLITVYIDFFLRSEAYETARPASEAAIEILVNRILARDFRNLPFWQMHFGCNVCSRINIWIKLLLYYRIGLFITLTMPSDTKIDTFLQMYLD